MIPSRDTFGCWPARQRGAALVVGLVLLVVITLVGVGAMQTTTLQEKMAGNLRDSNLAFQASESALRHCENNILQEDYDFQLDSLDLGLTNMRPQRLQRNQPVKIIDPTGTKPTLDAWIWNLDQLDPDSTNNQPWWTEPARDDNPPTRWWTNTANNNTGQIQALPANTLDGLSADPLCLIEDYINCISRQGIAIKPEDVATLDTTNITSSRCYYRITARGVGGSDMAVSMLQSTYMLYQRP